MCDKTNPDRQTAVLTPTLRDYLLGDMSGVGPDKKYNRKVATVKRTRNALTDFVLLRDELPEEWRNEVFDAQPLSDEYWNLERDISATLEFLYIGIGGEARFKNPLKVAVSGGEVALGRIETGMEVEPKFSVDPYPQADSAEVAKLIKNEEWDRLRSPQLYRFVRTAMSAGAIDFDGIEEYLEPPVGPDRVILEMNPSDESSKLSEETRERIEEHQQPDETVDEAVNRLLDSIEE